MAFSALSIALVAQHLAQLYRHPLFAARILLAHAHCEQLANSEPCAQAMLVAASRRCPDNQRKRSTPGYRARSVEDLRLVQAAPVRSVGSVGKILVAFLVFGIQLVNNFVDVRADPPRQILNRTLREFDSNLRL